ncbi:LxmA leader domain family RiPP [Streptomyces sp. NPDC127112]|uniref:LxmA leader domain family RiPP n=1 Tax=Streptomyces sp. NPDC127112 TaxID=3345364 RepID=UPI00362ECCAE
MDAAQLIAGYTAYTTAEEFGATAQGDAPATNPLTTIATVSSPECIVSLVSAASVGATAHVGC